MAGEMKGFMELMHELIEKLGPDTDQPLSESLTARAKVYAARMRLQHAVDQVDGLDAIREVAGNLIGCEELALYKVDHARAALWLYWSFGVDPNKYAVLDATKEPKLNDVLTGTMVFAQQDQAGNLLNIDAAVTAIVPIVVSEVVIAVLVLFRLLPQKNGLDAADRELCHVLSGCAGRAIGPPTAKFLKENSHAHK